MNFERALRRIATKAHQRKKEREAVRRFLDANTPPEPGEQTMRVKVSRGTKARYRRTGRLARNAVKP